MKLALFSAVLLAGALAAGAQNAPKPATAPKAAVAKPAAAAKPAATAAKALPAAAAKPVVPAKPEAPSMPEPQVLFSLKYIDLKEGSGPLAEPNKIYTVQYTGWLASDGTKFDSSYDHREPVVGPDGKPVLDADGNPKLGEAEPFRFPQGMGYVIPGWDQGFYGMKIGGKRKLFIPWQLAYGAEGRPPVIPAKADLVFELELVAVEELPKQPAR